MKKVNIYMHGRPLIPYIGTAGRKPTTHQRLKSTAAVWEFLSTNSPGQRGKNYKHEKLFCVSLTFLIMSSVFKCYYPYEK